MTTHTAAVIEAARALLEASDENASGIDLDMGRWFALKSAVFDLDAAPTPTPEAPPTDEELAKLRERALYSDGWKDRTSIASEALSSRALYDHGARRERARIIARIRVLAELEAPDSDLRAALTELADELETEQ